MKTVTTATPIIPAKTWKTMNAKEKSLFVGKVGVMVCSCGFIFGGVLVEGMVYDQYPN